VQSYEIVWYYQIQDIKTRNSESYNKTQGFMEAQRHRTLTLEEEQHKIKTLDFYIKNF
jgi:hypothetical protein